MGSKPHTSYISFMSSFQKSHYTHARLPSLANPLDFLNKPLTCYLASLDASISHSHRRVFIRHIERVLQQAYIRRLQCLESLVRPVYQRIYPLKLSTVKTKNGNSHPSYHHPTTLSKLCSSPFPTHQPRQRTLSQSPFPNPRCSIARQPSVAYPNPGLYDFDLEHGHRRGQGRH